MIEQNSAAEHNDLHLMPRATVAANAAFIALSLTMVPPLEFSMGNGEQRNSVTSTSELPPGARSPLPTCEALPGTGNETTSTVQLVLSGRMPYAKEYDQDPNARAVSPTDITRVVSSLQQLQEGGYSVTINVAGSSSDDGRVNPDGTTNPDGGLGTPSTANEALAKARAEAVATELDKAFQSKGLTATIASVESTENIIAPADLALLRINSRLSGLDLATAVEYYNTGQPLPAELQRQLDVLLKRGATVTLDATQTEISGQSGSQHCLPSDTPDTRVPITEKRTSNEEGGNTFKLPVIVWGMVIYGKRAEDRVKTNDAISTGPPAGKELALVPHQSTAELVPLPRGTELVHVPHSTDPVSEPGKELVHVPQTTSTELVRLSRLPARVEYRRPVYDYDGVFYEVEKIASIAETTQEAIVPQTLAIEAAPTRAAIEAAPVRLAIEAAPNSTWPRPYWEPTEGSTS